MFFTRTTRGAGTVVLADALISYLLFAGILSLLSLLSGVPDALNLSCAFGNGVFLFFALIVIVALAFNQLYFPVECGIRIDLVKRIVSAFTASFFGIAATILFVEGLTPLYYLYVLPLFLIFVAVYFFRIRVFHLRAENRERILILGVTEQALEIIRETMSKRYRGYDIVGLLTSVEGQVGTEKEGVPVLGYLHDLDEVVEERDVDSVVVTLRNRRGKLPVQELLTAKTKHIRILEGSNFYEKVKKKIIIDEFLKPSWFIFEEGFYHTSLHGMIKRTQGIIVSFILLVLLSPVLLIVALLIKLESSGPVFFIQERVGRDGKPFRLIKFRSMRSDAEKSGPTFAQKNDTRVTRVGAFIRKVRLDEIPQFINIFKGDMDLVGPRPERPVFVDQLIETVPYYNMRHSVRPGLTGWAQVNYTYGENLEDSREKLKYDLYYVKHFSWYLDVLILFMTIREVLYRKGQ